MVYRYIHVSWLMGVSIQVNVARGVLKMKSLELSLHPISTKGHLHIWFISDGCLHLFLRNLLDNIFIFIRFSTFKTSFRQSPIDIFQFVRKAGFNFTCQKLVWLKVTISILSCMYILCYFIFRLHIAFRLLI